MMFYEKKDVINAIHQMKIRLVKELILEHKTIKVSVSGDSMLPNIQPDTEIFVSSVKTSEEVKINDILLFYDDEFFFVLHRLMEIKGECFTLKGDNATCLDRIKFKQILGRECDGKMHSIASTVKKRSVYGYVVEIGLNQGKLSRCQVYKE